MNGGFSVEIWLAAVMLGMVRASFRHQMSNPMVAVNCDHNRASDVISGFENSK